MARRRWRRIPGAPAYKQCTDGRTKGPRGLLKPTPDKDGYLYVTLRAGLEKPRRVHVAVLVLETFAGPRPPGAEACHSREAAGRQDCRLEVLSWGNHRKNERDKLSGWNEIGRGASPPSTSLFPVSPGQA